MIQEINVNRVKLKKTLFLNLIVSLLDFWDFTQETIRPSIFSSE